MRKFLALFLFIIIVIIIALILNINVTTQKGTNYQWYSVKIPLYLKILDFFDRHYNYKELTKTIIKDAKNDEERVMKIFTWTCENIRGVPYGFPIIDDHVWYIIVRGYGAADQYSDVFTTLCNYAGIDAFFSLVDTKDRVRIIPLSFVKIKEKWCVFDPFRGVYFKNNKGSLADVKVIKSGRYSVQGRTGAIEMDYSSYISNLPSIKDMGFKRANIQSPLNRLLFEIKKWRK